MPHLRDAQLAAFKESLTWVYIETLIIDTIGSLNNWEVKFTTPFCRSDLGRHRGHFCFSEYSPTDINLSPSKLLISFFLISF